MDTPFKIAYYSTRLGCCAGLQPYDNTNIGMHTSVEDYIIENILELISSQEHNYKNAYFPAMKKNSDVVYSYLLGFLVVSYIANSIEEHMTKEEIKKYEDAIYLAYAYDFNPPHTNEIKRNLPKYLEILEKKELSLRLKND